MVVTNTRFKATLLRKAVIRIALIAVVLLTPLGLKAQSAECLAVCDGTATSSNAPIRKGNGSQTEFIYPASMLGVMNGATIFSLRFYSTLSTSSEEHYSSTVKVFMQEVSETTETTSSWRYEQNTATKVYEGTGLTVAGGELYIALSTPYVYHGGEPLF